MQITAKEITESAKAGGFSLTDHEIDEVRNLCERKMEMAGIEDKESYFPYLFDDEIRNYIVRKHFNAVSMKRMGG